MKKWICRIEKEYSEEDYEDLQAAEEQFIEDIARNNFGIYSEEIEETFKN